MSSVLKTAFSTVNRPKYDENYLVAGVLHAVTLGKGFLREKQGKHVEEIEYERCEFVFQLQGITKQPFEVCLYTGTVFSDEPVTIKGESRGKKQQEKVYNRFTTTCLRLGVISDEDIVHAKLFGKRLEEVSTELATIKDLPVIVKVSKKDDCWLIDPAKIHVQTKEKTYVS